MTLSGPGNDFSGVDHHASDIHLLFAARMQSLLAGQTLSALAVAYSGGLDSTILLHLARHWASKQGVPLFGFHVNHGISPHADAWEAHCRQSCSDLNIAFACERIVLPSRRNLEARARAERYRALGQLCLLHQVPWILTAHHQDDQAETVLLQILRGAQHGKGMAELGLAPGLLATDQVQVARPLLNWSRTALVQMAMRAKVGGVQRVVRHIDDESNADPAYARNFLRLRVVPLLAQPFPGFRQVLARHAQQARESARLHDELAELDWSRYGSDRALQLDCLEQLSPARAHNLLRYWMAMQGARLPSSSWLRQLATQARVAREDAQVCVIHPDCEIHRFQRKLYLAKKWSPVLAAIPFRWQGEAELAFPVWGGCLRVTELTDNEPGLPAAWLRTQTLQLSPRSGGERIRVAANRPHRSLKQHYQTLEIPAWQRTRLPLVHVMGHPPELLYAAGIGCASRFCEPTGVRVRLDWHSDIL